MEGPAHPPDRADLLETAFLLWGEENDAETRVTAALARIRDPADRDAVLRALLRTRAMSGVQAARSDPWWVAPQSAASAARTAAALAGLELRDRAALVLVELDGMDPADLPDRVGIDAPDARLARARAAVGSDPRPALTELLAVRHPPQRDDAQAAVEVRRIRRRRRVRPVLAGFGLAAAVTAALLVPRGGDAPPAPNEVTRGSLAGDAGVLAAAAELPWPAGAVVTGRRVAVATDALGARWVLLVGTAGSGPRAAWFTGQTGTPVSRLMPATERAVQVGEPLALATDAGLLVAADPGEDIALSWAPDPADPTGARTFTELATTDGLAAAALDLPERTGSAALVRIGHEGDVEPISPDVADDRVPVPLPRLQSPAGGATPEQLATAAATTAVALPAGLAAGDLPVVPVWSGRFDSGPAGEVDAVAVRVDLPGGTSVLSTAFAQGRENQTFLLGGCGTQVPRTTAVAARCSTADPSTGRLSSTVLVVGLEAPAQLLTRDGARVAALAPDASGVLAVRDDDGTGTVVRLADGTELTVAEPS